MSSAVLDTSVASFAFRKDSRLSPYEPYLSGVSALPFQVVAELRFGARNAQWGPDRRGDLEIFISRCAVVPYSDSLATIWAEVMHVAKLAGFRLEAGDAWVAATAILIEVPLLTHDRDFTRLTHPDLRIECHA